MQQLPWLAAMGILILASAFFSCSEAALFYLGRGDRRQLASGKPAQRLAARLLNDSDRLLTTILFCNLLVNVAYFAISSIASINLDRAGEHAEAGLLALGSLMALIVFGEMLPKNLAVLQPRMMSTLAAVPLSAMIQVLDPVLPAFRFASLVSQRVLWPTFEAEPYLRVGDLEKAVELSTSDAALLSQEQNVLQSLVLLSDIRVEELMRPRTRFLSFRPPVSLADLEGRMPPSGYLLVTEPDSDEVAGAVPLRDLPRIPDGHLERLARPVVYVPWCTTAAQALEVMHKSAQRVVAVVNELGETIGILTYEDVLDTIFIHTASRSERLLKRDPIRRVGDDVWVVTGMTNLRRLVRYFDVERPPSKSVTVAGVLQEVLERLPTTGDQCRWGPFQFKVLDVPERGQLLVEVTRVDRVPEEAAG